MYCLCTVAVKRHIYVESLSLDLSRCNQFLKRSALSLCTALTLTWFRFPRSDSSLFAFVSKLRTHNGRSGCQSTGSTWHSGPSCGPSCSLCCGPGARFAGNFSKVVHRGTLLLADVQALQQVVAGISRGGGQAQVGLCSPDQRVATWIALEWKHDLDSLEWRHYRLALVGVRFLWQSR
jgi:hypothetical protein